MAVGRSTISRLSQILTVLLVCILIITFSPINIFGYSVLTHEAIIDMAWETHLRPLLLKRFPDLQEEQLKEAHAYAYGGCIIQDMGYYPFANKFFSDLLHYVRSGEFVEIMINESQDANEYAFALGALSHYAADNNGHPIATNRAVPIYYPELQRKYGNIVTYEKNPTAHIKAEFGFDVVQVAKGSYASENYHSFIGFKVSTPLLERAVRKTYGIELKDLFTNEDLAFNTYRSSVGSLIPYMTKVAWQLKKDEITKAIPGITRKKFIYALKNSQYKKEFGSAYTKPSFGQKTFAFFFRILPKIGPLKVFQFKIPTPQTEQLFIESINITFNNYKTLLTEVGAGRLKLENKDFDTGKLSQLGEYTLSDNTYIKLLDKFAKQDFKTITPEIKESILKYFRDLNAPLSLKKDKEKWYKLLEQLDRLKAYQV